MLRLGLITAEGITVHALFHDIDVLPEYLRAVDVDELLAVEVVEPLGLGILRYAGSFALIDGRPVRLCCQLGDLSTWVGH